MPSIGVPDKLIAEATWTASGASTGLANAAAVIAAGADGIAVISALFGAEAVEGRARDLRARVDVALAERGAR